MISRSCPKIAGVADTVPGMRLFKKRGRRPVNRRSLRRGAGFAAGVAQNASIGLTSPPRSHTSIGSFKVWAQRLQSTASSSEFSVSASVIESALSGCFRISAAVMLPGAAPGTIRTMTPSKPFAGTMTLTGTPAMSRLMMTLVRSIQISAGREGVPGRHSSLCSNRTGRQPGCSIVSALLPVAFGACCSV